MSTAALTADGSALPRPAVNPWIIALAVTLATFMEVLDTSIANVSLPHIAGSLSAGTDESTWVLTSYLVSNAIVLPLSGWISSIIGRKRFYMSCVAIFTVSSLLCGLAPNLGMLIFFRVLQGAGGGGLQPSEQAILADTFPPAKRGMAFAVYGLAVVLAPAIGPTLGGWITDNFTWRWIFLLNIPVGMHVPEAHNDMIFALVGEQIGFLGALVLLGGYLVLFAAGIEIASATKEPFGRLVAVGIVPLFAGQTFLNLMVTLKLMPVTGVTLPFVSYGGSSIIASFMCAGLLLNIGQNRPMVIARESFEFDP